MSSLELCLFDLAARRGLPAFEPDSQGCFHLVVDDDLRIACVEFCGVVELRVALGTVDSDRTSWVRVAGVLEGALATLKHARVTPALRADGVLIILTRLACEHLTPARLDVLLDRYLIAVERARTRFSALARVPPRRPRHARRLLRP